LFILEHHVSVDLTQSKEEEEGILCLNGIDEDGVDEVLASDDVNFGDEDNAVDMTGVPVWRKKLGKILEKISRCEFQD